jgi:hypothetical protein
VAHAFLIQRACFGYSFFILVSIATATNAIRMIIALASAVVTMFVLVCFDMMPINAQTMTRP